MLTVCVCVCMCMWCRNAALLFSMTFSTSVMTLTTATNLSPWSRKFWLDATLTSACLCRTASCADIPRFDKTKCIYILICFSLVKRLYVQWKIYGLLVLPNVNRDPDAGAVHTGDVIDGHPLRDVPRLTNGRRVSVPGTEDEGWRSVGRHDGALYWLRHGITQTADDPAQRHASHAAVQTTVHHPFEIFAPVSYALYTFACVHLRDLHIWINWVL